LNFSELFSFTQPKGCFTQPNSPFTQSLKNFVFIVLHLLRVKIKAMRKIISILFFVALAFWGRGQTSMYRSYPQPTPSLYGPYSTCDMVEPQRTMDRGYIFSFNPWTPNLHEANPL